MKRTAKHILFILLFLFSYGFTFLGAQVSFRTIVPSRFIVTGESFQVQFIIEDAEKISGFTPPLFKGFRFVAGPNTYTGSGVNYGHVRQFTNLVYTLVAAQKGRFIIPGAAATVNGKNIHSNEVFIEVISKAEALKRLRKTESEANNDTEYYLKPGEDPLEKIRQNLFLKVLVDRRTCFVGEPIVATYKLYSRLESRSDIVKNPGFYGFGVYDMISLEDKLQTTETIRGKPFDVHIIRKVQLYPMQAGTFTIDPMELDNKVEFSRSMVNKRTEQQIVEGIYGGDDEKKYGPNTETFETALKTEAVDISVKPLPDRSSPENSGAVGLFSMEAVLTKDQLAKNEEGFLVINIRGEGNFTQLIPPIVAWPAGLEGFDGSASEALNKSTVPLSGSKSFRYPFVSSKPGVYRIPPVAFSFFNITRHKYETILSQPLPLTILPNENKARSIAKTAVTLKNPAFTGWWMIVAGIFLSVIILLAWLLKTRNSKKIESPLKSKASITVEEVLLPVSQLTAGDDKIYFHELNRAVWFYFSKKFDVSGSDMNKPVLVSKLREHGISETLIYQLITIMRECETGMYTEASVVSDKEILIYKTRDTLRLIDASL